MKAEVKLSKDPNKPFRPGVWLNEFEIKTLIDRLSKNSWLRADLIEKFEQAKQTAEKQLAAYLAEQDITIIDL